MFVKTPVRDKQLVVSTWFGFTPLRTQAENHKSKRNATTRGQENAKGRRVRKRLQRKAIRRYHKWRLSYCYTFTPHDLAHPRYIFSTYRVLFTFVRSKNFLKLLKQNAASQHVTRNRQLTADSHEIGSPFFKRGMHRFRYGTGLAPRLPPHSQTNVGYRGVTFVNPRNS